MLSTDHWACGQQQQEVVDVRLNHKPRAIVIHFLPKSKLLTCQFVQGLRSLHKQQGAMQSLLKRVFIEICLRIRKSSVLDHSNCTPSHTTKWREYTEFHIQRGCSYWHGGCRPCQAKRVHSNWLGRLPCVHNSPCSSIPPMFTRIDRRQIKAQQKNLLCRVLWHSVWSVW